MQPDWPHAFFHVMPPHLTFATASSAASRDDFNVSDKTFGSFIKTTTGARPGDIDTKTSA
jgi:hypothetical protein